MKVKNLILGIVSIFSANAMAIGGDSEGGLFVEPMVTWQKGDGDLSLPTPFTDGTAELDGFGLGARLGFHVMESFFIGVDGRYSFLNYSDNKLNLDTDGNAWNIGPVVGFQMPTALGLRIWASYIAAGDLDLDDDNQNIDLTYKSGSGFRVGAGIKLALASINAEYQKMEYDKTSIESVGIFDPNSDTSKINLKDESLILSVSFPIAI